MLEEAYSCGALFYLSITMFYIPNNTYKNLDSMESRYDAVLKEICYQSKEAQRLRNRVASFNEQESKIARNQLRKVVEHILHLRGVSHERLV